MKDEEFAISWDGEVVGFVDSPSFDMFHLYGKWVPSNSERTKEFLAAMESLDDEAVEAVAVLVGSTDPKITGEVTDFSDGEIEILMRPRR